MVPTPSMNKKHLKPTIINQEPTAGGQHGAVNMLRQKISGLYASEPTAKAELQEIKTMTGPKSKHQKFMDDLSHSGKSLAEIQTAWHDYYTKLSDNDKHEVWNEFYDNNKKIADQQATPNTKKQQATAQQKSIADIRNTIHANVNKSVNKRKKRTTRNQNLRSAMFGLSMGLLTLLIMTFTFFNERFIAPFITPSKTVSATPIIVDSENTAVGPLPKIIIPKINIEVPIIFDEPSITEESVQRALEEGTLHYGTTPNPGEKGNSVIFGHSSNNILNSGKYKFAFVLLNRLQPGDTFFVHYKGTRYIYKIFDTQVVKPTDVWVLNPTDKESSMTLITCDPPGTSLNRLVIFAEQISPDPSGNTEPSISATQPASVTTDFLPSNAPSLWDRVRGWF